MTEENTAVASAALTADDKEYGTPTLTVQLKMLDDGLEPPSYAHPGDAGADLRAREDVVLAPGERRLVPTGVSIALPDGFVALIHPRSGLATKHGLTVVNAPGTVDAGYRGEIAVTLLNTDQTSRSSSGAAIELHRWSFSAWSTRRSSPLRNWTARSAAEAGSDPPAVSAAGLSPVTAGSCPEFSQGHTWRCSEISSTRADMRCSDN